jgi:hypothetical protein
MENNMAASPKWTSTLVGSVILFVGALSLGLPLGIVPMDGRGNSLVSSLIIVSVGLGFVFGGLQLWIPDQTSHFLRATLGLIPMLLIVILCTWTAFATNIVYMPPKSTGIQELIENTFLGERTLFVVVLLIIGYAFLSTLVAPVGWMYGNAGKRIDLLGEHT